MMWNLLSMMDATMHAGMFEHLKIMLRDVDILNTSVHVRYAQL